LKMNHKILKKLSAMLGPAPRMDEEIVEIYHFSRKKNNNFKRLNRLIPFDNLEFFDNSVSFNFDRYNHHHSRFEGVLSVFYRDPHRKSMSDLNKVS